MKMFRDLFLPIALIFTGAIAEAQVNDEWTEIQKVLTDCTGLYTGANNNVATSGLPDGPLLGNGLWNVVLNHQNSVVFRNYSKLSDGLSVRCIKNQVK